MKTINDELFLSIERQLDRIEQLNDTVYETAKTLITEPIVSDEDFTWLCDLNEALTNLSDNFSKFLDTKGMPKQERTHDSYSSRTTDKYDWSAKQVVTQSTLPKSHRSELYDVEKFGGEMIGHYRSTDGMGNFRTRSTQPIERK